MADRLRVDLNGGKYTVVMTESGHLSALRYGEPWRDLVGDGMVCYMAHEIEELRDHRAALLAACEKLDQIDCCEGHEIKDEDYKIFWEALGMARAAVALARPKPQKGS